MDELNYLIGSDYWHIGDIMVSDGPNGLRKQEGDADFMGTKPSKPAVCYPTSSALGCSFDTELMNQLGQALGEECLAEGISVLLGPGVNHKRSPLCGRNFEYFSEDPVLTGELAAALVNGVQSKGVGTCVKHFAANSREKGRLVCNSIVDERTLMEIYLKQFQIVVEKAKPWSIMTAYNKLNGTYCAENEWLLQDIARKKWGFDGIYISDWGGVSDPAASVKAGLHVEMPGGDRGTVKRLRAALDSGVLSQELVEERIGQVKDLIDRAKQAPMGTPYDLPKHLRLARKIASESAVLLKNNGCLPLRKGGSILLVGQFAKNPRYQGAGSSKVNPAELDCIYDALLKEYPNMDYAEGYDLENEAACESLRREVCTIAPNYDCVIVVAGLPNSYESEGFDRKSLDMPESHNCLIEELARCNPNTVVVLQGGSVMCMQWLDKVDAVLMMHLSGCQGGGACADLLTGKVNPSGKLAETYPIKVEDNPSYHNFDRELLDSEYTEGIFTGYRYYEKANKPICFPFGHGLSYTSFAYNDLQLQAEGDDLLIRFTLANTGSVSGKEAVQIYAGCCDSHIQRPIKELKAFVKVQLSPGESKHLTVRLNRKELAVYNVDIHDWDVEQGTYQVYVGSSSADIRLEDSIFLTGTVMAPQEEADLPVMLQPVTHTPRNPKPFTKDSAVEELKATALGRLFVKVAYKAIGSDSPEAQEMINAMFFEAPLRALMMVSDAITRDMVDAIADIFNGHALRGIRQIISGSKRKER